MIKNGDAPVHYKGCKVSASDSKQGFRVFLDLSQKNPVDKLVRWDRHASIQAAWKAALDLIDTQGKGV